ncbi:uncharacterized protein LOC131525193 [Onychostoma macrolepis]|uniref:uncharacterized protein LOC131525193 n=1 Tax=Onychostoma macrolepis TaxID=369639 RepID=UPI00272CB4D3|nr:uncharacterized protein LOC131525193 [Onychostoma macrolepis]
MDSKLQQSSRFRRFSPLLLFCLVYHNGNTDIPVSGKKGGNITLTCEIEADKIVHVELIFESKDIDVCQTEECSGRVFKEGNCDVVIKNLSFSDAGKYFMRVHYNNDQTNVAQQKERMYQLHITDDISVKAGKPLKMHVLMSFADKVEKSSSEGWKEVWKRGHGVWSNRMNVSDENLIIKAFTDNDAGSYRVLDSKGEIFITVTVTESGTESAGKQDTDKDKTGDTEEHEKWILPVGVGLGILVLAVIGVVIWRCRHTGYMQTPVQENPEHPEIPLNNLN